MTKILKNAEGKHVLVICFSIREIIIQDVFDLIKPVVQGVLMKIKLGCRQYDIAETIQIDG